MRVEHRAIDGALISIEAEADLSAPATAAGWAIVPSLMRSHPFVIYPPGHTSMIEQTVKSDFRHVEVRSREEYTVKGGTLHVAQVEIPTATKRTRTLTVGGWEGRTACLTTTLVGTEIKRLVEVFETLRFSETARGLEVLSPVVPRPRPPEVFKEIRGVGILAIRPAIASELERVPRSRGFQTEHGELFRFRQGSGALMFVSRSAIAGITPFGQRDSGESLAAAATLRIEWMPPASRVEH
jgi:hypothetical protein